MTQYVLSGAKKMARGKRDDWNRVSERVAWRIIGAEPLKQLISSEKQECDQREEV